MPNREVPPGLALSKRAWVAQLGQGTDAEWVTGPQVSTKRTQTTVGLLLVVLDQTPAAWDKMWCPREAKSYNFRKMSVCDIY